jgi:hypothetical protein
MIHGASAARTHHPTIQLVIRFPGDPSEGATPVPIPNTVVKPLSADGTAWATAWESRSLPGAFLESPPQGGLSFFGRTRVADDPQHRGSKPLDHEFATTV